LTALPLHDSLPIFCYRLLGRRSNGRRLCVRGGRTLPVHRRVYFGVSCHLGVCVLLSYRRIWTGSEIHHSCEKYLAVNVVIFGVILSSLTASPVSRVHHLLTYWLQLIDAHWS